MEVGDSERSPPGWQAAPAPLSRHGRQTFRSGAFTSSQNPIFFFEKQKSLTAFAGFRPRDQDNPVFSVFGDELKTPRDSPRSV